MKTRAQDFIKLTHGQRITLSEALDMRLVYLKEVDNYPHKSPRYVAKEVDGDLLWDINRKLYESRVHSSATSPSAVTKPRRKMERQDFLDAIDHMQQSEDDELLTSSFELSEPRMMSIDELGQYDDLSSWVEIEEGEILKDDRALDSFRGSAWKRRAGEWLRPEDMPPIVIMLTPTQSAIADGRGRTNYAVGMGWDSVPVVIAKHRELERNARPRPAKVVVRRVGSRWEAKMYDSAGHLRSSVSGSDMVVGSKYISGKQRVEDKIKDHWPDLPVEYEDDEMKPNADLEWIKGDGVDSDGHNLTWWKNKIKKWKGEYSRPRAEILVRRWDRAGQNAGPETFSIDDLSAAKAAAKAWSASSGSAEVTARIEIPYEKTHTIHIGEYRGTNPGFYVWTVDKNGAPVTRRGPWEKDYEAIGVAKVEARASNQYDYVVTFGSDPEATDFEIVKAFKAWSGEVHYSTDLPRVGRRLREYR